MISLRRTGEEVGVVVGGEFTPPQVGCGGWMLPWIDSENGIKWEAEVGLKKSNVLLSHSYVKKVGGYYLTSSSPSSGQVRKRR